MVKKINRKEFNNIYFVSDFHLHHDKQFIYGPRGFNNICEHDNLILEFISNLHPYDIVFHLGDFMFGRNISEIKDVINMFPCRIEFIKGNHDSLLSKYLKKNKFKFLPAEHELYIIVEDEVHPIRIILSHYPMLRWNKSHYGTWNLHGHEHGELKFSLPKYKGKKYAGKRIDVGVDTALKTIGKPMWTFDELKPYMDNKRETPHN